MHAHVILFMPHWLNLEIVVEMIKRLVEGEPAQNVATTYIPDDVCHAVVVHFEKWEEMDVFVMPFSIPSTKPRLAVPFARPRR